MAARIIDIDGNGLSVGDLVQIGYFKAQVRITDESWAAVKEGRKVIDDILEFIFIYYLHIIQTKHTFIRNTNKII